MNTIELFIFDMDGVLTESSEQHYLAWKQLAEELGISIDRKFNETLKGISRKASLDKILAYGGIIEKYTEEIKLQLAERKNQAYTQMIEQFDHNNLFSGVSNIMQELKNKGIKIAIGSASKNAPLLVKLLGIEAYIDYIVNPEDVQRGKPAPDIFLKAAEALGIDPGKCVGVEDSIAGIQAIKSAGMTAVGIGKPEELPQADFIYEKTGELDIEAILNSCLEEEAS